MKSLFIAEKPSVALEIAKALDIKGSKRNGFIESETAVVTWCVGHLVNMSYPEKYDDKYKKWTLKDLPFLPKVYKYEVISNVKQQFNIVKEQLLRNDVSIIYVCTDSGREGEYIYRLVDDMAKVKDKEKRRVWIDSQTVEEIRRGVKRAKPLSDYDNLAAAAYLRAKEDYLMGINFSRLLTLSYSKKLSGQLGKNYVVIAVGRVMTCVLGMIVERELEVRNFVKTPYYKIQALFPLDDDCQFTGEWKATDASDNHISRLLFKDIGFLDKERAKDFIASLKENNDPVAGRVEGVNRKKEKKNPPLLYNLAELQNDLAKRFKLSPDETLKIAQKLYEKKLLTYPRTDARVLSKAVAKEIDTNLKGLANLDKRCQLSSNDGLISNYAAKVLQDGLHKDIDKTRYVNDKAITDHYAIIPTGQGLDNFNRLTEEEKKVYILIARRFLSIFYPAAIYSQLSITTKIKEESFYTSSKICIEEGYLKIIGEETKDQEAKSERADILGRLKKGQQIQNVILEIKESETTPPKRYTSGSIILAMENAGKLIEDEELREQIKGSGIGTSATRAEILNKLQKISYINLNKKTQILTPTILGEKIYEVVRTSIPTLIKPELTASWEKGLSMIARGEISPEEYMIKLEAYIEKNVKKVLALK